MIQLLGDDPRLPDIRDHLDESHDAILVAGTHEATRLAAYSSEHSDKPWIVLGPNVERSVASLLAQQPTLRVLGVGTVAASLRLQQLLAARLKIWPGHVSVFLAGEAGERALPLWSRATVAGIPLHEWAVPGHGKLSVRDRIDLTMAARQPYAGDDLLAARAILDAIGRNEHRILPISQLAPSFGGIVLSLPAIVGANGPEAPLPMPLSDNELAGLRDAAARLRNP